MTGSSACGMPSQVFSSRDLFRSGTTTPPPMRLPCRGTVPVSSTGRQQDGTVRVWNLDFWTTARATDTESAYETHEGGCDIDCS